MHLKVPILSIKIDKILLTRKESRFSVNVNSKCEKNIFYDAANNSINVASNSVIDETEKLSDADENIIQELHDILSDDANFFPSDKTNNLPKLPGLDGNNISVEISDYDDFFEFDCPPIVVSPSKVSFSNFQSDSDKELVDWQLNNTECSETFSTQIFTSNDIIQNHFIYDGILDEVFLNASNESEKNNFGSIRELRVDVQKLSDEEILSYINPKAPVNDKNNSRPQKELRIVLEKMTDKEIKVYRNASRNNKNINIWPQKNLQVPLTRITGSKYSKVAKKSALNMTQDSEYEENFISIDSTTNANFYSEDDEVANSLRKLFGDTIDNNSGKSPINCPCLDENIEDVLSPNEQYDNQQQDLMSEIKSKNSDHHHVESQTKYKETEKPKNGQSKKTNVGCGKKRKIIKQDFGNDKFKTRKVFAYDGVTYLPGIDKIGKTVDKSIPIIKNAGTIILIHNETILKRSVRIYTSTAYKILFAGKYVYNDNYKRTIENFGGKVVSDPEVATILVAKKFKRTQEFLLAICRGIPIVSIDWIHDCVENHGFVDSKDYLLKDPLAEQKYGFNLKNSLKKAGEKRIFEGYTFVIRSSIIQTSFNQLKCLITAAGGVVLKKSPKVIKLHTVIVTNSANKKKNETLMNKKQNCFERVVSLDWITDCIIKQTC